ncbi:hypothetical protein EZV62_022834 [Acer yangbiense]|uniref:RING-type E3 ubiquitin transferase n=1 Tax=Acer yangbiense TaxID=1000413 RepID=A0A5C7GZU7_9ROSI|nr:hypothetical protein EZV62_022834 [Acer yangbiense]
MARILYEMKQNDVFFIHPPPLSPPSSLSNVNHENESTQTSSIGRTSPLLLLLLISVAVVVFIAGLLHLLVRYFIKRPSSSLLPVHDHHQQPQRNPETSRSHSLQRQLQQLFRQHDSGLDQALIDALPVFYYKDVMGLKEPFDCAVCLCEFADQDKLRLLPTCSHAFHISCIDTWLLSNSTCPLCRGILSSSNLSMKIPVSSFDVLRDISNGFAIEGAENGFSCHQKVEITEEESVAPKRVLSVRLGKFKSLNGGGDNNSSNNNNNREISSCNLDARRCYSMGTFQYVVGDSDLQVALSHARGCRDGVSSDSKLIKENSSVEEEEKEEAEEKKICGRSRGESFSVSKIWLWSKKNRLPTTSLDSHMALSSLSYYKFANQQHY